MDHGKSVKNILSAQSQCIYQELVLKDAAWVADSGRFNEAVKNPAKFSEVEPFAKNVIVGRGSIIDATEIPHIITEVK